MATEVKRTMHNPFRTPTVTPNPTGAGPSSTSVTTAENRRPESLPSMPPAPASMERERVPQRQGTPHDDLASELQSVNLEDSTPFEPPPAYTPSANPYQGEATVEYGPQRPFHPPPPAPPLPPQFSGMSMQQQQFMGMPPGGPGIPLSTHSTGNWSQYPGQGAPSANTSGYFGPPPRHPLIAGPAPAPQPSLSPAPNRLSEFSRDFYASVPSNRQPSPAPSNSSSGVVSEPEHFERERPGAITSYSFAPPDGLPPSQYVPPEGPPPLSPTSSYAPPSGPPPSHSSPSSNNSDDWRPTNTPTPGRPLLNKGRVLVYPRGFECKKCTNTGYKALDPSHPCRKCWDKYAKPYTGALVYAPRSGQSQRPLPTLRPPQLRHQQSQSQPSLLEPPTSSNLGRSQSAYRPFSSPWQGYPGRAVSSPCSAPFPGGFAPSQRPLGMPTPQLNFTRGLPPPGSMVVRPGDSRIGGRLCWRCDGSGTISFMIFDVEQCPVCNGIGRIF